MKRIPLAVAALPLFFLFACSDSEAAGSKPTVDWPASGSTIFADTPISIAGTELGNRVKVVKGAGAAVAADAQILTAGVAKPLDLSLGKAQLTFQLIDIDGKSMGTGLACEASYTVVPAPSERGVFFQEPADGAQVKSPFKVKFGLIGMGLTPASDPATIPDKTKGHHHLIINGGPLMPGVAVPANATNIHFGKAQTETELELAPGKYSLTMQFADGLHLSYGPSMAATIHIEVIR